MNGHGHFQSVSHLTDFHIFEIFLSVRGGVKGGSNFFIEFLGVSLKRVGVPVNMHAVIYYMHFDRYPYSFELNFS